MELVTRPDDSQTLQRDMATSVPVFDVVLDDGSLLPNVAVVEGRAVGVIAGGHSGFIAFADVPELASRQVVHKLRVAGAYSVPVLGAWLRRRWAVRLGASPSRPSWIPSL
jgi:hypothetical protein